MRPAWTPVSTFAPFAFLVLAGATLTLQNVAFADIAPDGPPEAIAAAVQEKGLLVGAFIATATLAGLSLLVFADALGRELPALPWLARVATALWAMTWFAAATLAYGAVDLAGYFDHPAGAKTQMLASYAFITSPAGAALAGVLAIGVSRAVRAAEGWPGWYAGFSLVCGILAVLGGATLALSFTGMLGLAFLPLWLVVTAILLPLAAWKARLAAAA